MEFTEEKLDKFVKELKEINNFADDGICTLEDMIENFRVLYARVEEILELLTEMAKLVKERPS